MVQVGRISKLMVDYMANGKIGSVRTSPRGPRFEVLLKNENATGCVFYGKQCNHCDIPTLGMGINPKENQRLLVEDIVKLDHEKDRVKQVNIYGSGNVLSRKEISDETFNYSLICMLMFRNLECVGIDSRPEIAISSGKERIEHGLSIVSRTHIRLEVIVGYETQDVKLRTSEQGLNKKISERHMELVFELAKQLGLGLQINVMLMPVPTMQLSDAVEEAVRTIMRVRELKDKFGVEFVLVNLHPLYITRKMLRKWGDGILENPLPSHAEIQEILSRCGNILPIFVGLDDEGLSMKKNY